MIRITTTLTAIFLALATQLGARNISRTYFDVTSITDTCVTVTDPAPGLSELTVECRGALSNDRERVGASRSAWGFEFGNGWRAEIRSGNTMFGSIADNRITTLTVSHNDTIMTKKDFDHGFDPYSNSYNSLIITLRLDGTADIAGGARTTMPLTTLIGINEALNSPIGLFADGELKTSSIVVESVSDPRLALDSGLTANDVINAVELSTDRYEGIWDYLDRENDPRISRPGGRYTLATLSDGSGGYNLIYIGGAETNRSKWSPGMIKGNIRPTVFVDSFDLVWHDSMFETIERDIHASIEQNAILILDFPLLKTKLRFSRRAPRNK